MELLINGANLLYVAAYFTTNLLRLRLLTMVAAACLCTYFLLQPVPLYNVVAWNLFFLSLNTVQVTRLLLKRRAERHGRGRGRSRFLSRLRRSVGRSVDFRHLSDPHRAKAGS